MVLMRVSFGVCVLLLVDIVGCAQIIKNGFASKSEPIEEPKTADLTMLINETLAINNKTLAPVDSGKRTADDWTFDMVEYDLMEFLQDLSARYKLSNRTEANFKLEGAELLRARIDKLTSTSPSPVQEAPSTRSSSQKALDEPPTSLASGDHDIGESSWQYGIFDRFTRPRTSSTTTTPEPKVGLGLDSNGRFDMRQFNSEECGLRTYSVEPTGGGASSLAYPQQLDSSSDEISKTLSQRRQKIPPLGPIIYNKRKQQQNMQIDETSADASGGFGDRNFDQVEPPAEGAPGAGQAGPEVPAAPEADRQPNYPSEGDSEFNLASRRYWLQQQLGNTLQLLGFNSSSQSIAEFLNQTSGLSLSMRENMMKRNGLLAIGSAASKAARSDNDNDPSSLNEDDLLASTGRELKARQDELKLEPRVIGGSDAKLGDSPWSVSLQALVSRPGTVGVEYRHYCGGTIIGEHYVLTAAHCLDFMVGRESRLFVVVGDINWRMSTATLYGRRFGIDKLIIHSGYKSTAFGHDIGLIRTKEPIRTVKVNGKYIVNSVCLPEKNVEHTGEAELVGWGLFSSRNEMADSLQIADVPILPRPLCVDLYRRRTGLIQWLIGIELITEKQVCAGTFGRGICQGDSGSALVVNERIVARSAESLPEVADLLSGKRANVGLRSQHTRATQIGVVAFGGIRRCSYQSLPGVYMQTSKYLDWILPRIQP